MFTNLAVSERDLRRLLRRGLLTAFHLVFVARRDAPGDVQRLRRAARSAAWDLGWKVRTWRYGFEDRLDVCRGRRRSYASEALRGGAGGRDECAHRVQRRVPHAAPILADPPPRHPAQTRHLVHLTASLAL